MFHITEVSNFQWILIHIGNNDNDTAGCLLVGDTFVSFVNQDGRINNSTIAYKRIYPIIANEIARGREVWIAYLDEAICKNEEILNY